MNGSYIFILNYYHVHQWTFIKFYVVVVRSLSFMWHFVTPWTVVCQASLSFTISLSLLKLMSIEPMRPSNHIILCCPLLLLLSIFPESGFFFFPMSWLFGSGGQSIEAPALASVLPMNIQDWFPLGLTGLISLLSKELSRVFSSPTVLAPKCGINSATLIIISLSFF